MERTSAYKHSWKKIGLTGVALLILLSSLAYCAQASSMWSQTYFGYTTTALIATSDGGYAMAGRVGNDFLLMKVDANGTQEWTQAYDNGEYEGAYSLVQTSDGGYALAGQTGDKVGIYYQDLWLVKTDSSGNMEWNYVYGGPEIERAGAVIQTDDGGYAIAGYTDSFGARFNDFWLMKTDPSGNMQWNQTYGTTENEQAYSLVGTFDGGFALAGTVNNFTDNSIWLVKVDPLGNMDWNQTFGGQNGTSVSGPQALVATSDGGYALVGGKTSPTITSYGNIQDGLLIKTNARGEEEWNQTYGTPGDDALNALVQAADGGYALVGSRDLFGPTKGEVWLVKTDSEGKMLWNKTYGGLPDDYGQYHMDQGHGLVQAPDEGYAILAETEYPVPQSSLGELRVWLIKTDEVGVVPELSAWVILSLVLAMTPLVLLIKKKQTIAN